jgi:hypothetical protein
MKVKTKLDLNVSMGNVCIDGTSCQGYMSYGTRYKDLVKVFGEPQGTDSRDSKTRVVWAGKINGLVFIPTLERFILNIKNGKRSSRDFAPPAWIP